MRSLLSAGLIAVSATVLAAQTTTSPGVTGSGSQQTITMNGCITAGSTAAAPFMLSNAVPLAPTTVPPANTMTMPPATGTVGATGTVAGTPGSTAGTTGTVAGTSSATGATTGVPTGTSGVTAGTTGTMTGSTGATPPATGVAGTAGAATTTPTTGAAGTPGGVTGVPGMPATTYQLSGTSVGSFVGQSVQVTGTLVPSPNVAATAGTQSSGVTRPTGGTGVAGATNQPAVPQFQVTRVEPLGYRCPQ